MTLDLELSSSFWYLCIIQKIQLKSLYVEFSWDIEDHLHLLRGLGFSVKQYACKGHIVFKIDNHYWRLYKLIYKIIKTLFSNCSGCTWQLQSFVSCFQLIPLPLKNIQQYWSLFWQTEEIIGFFPTYQNALFLLCLFYSYNEIITVRGRPIIRWVCCAISPWY